MAELINLLTQIRDLAGGSGGQVAWFADRMNGLKKEPPPAQLLDVCEKLKDLSGLATSQTRPAVDAVITAASFLHWQRSYTLKDGFDQHYLDNYGWFNLVSPEGIYLSEEIRVSVGYWGSGLEYKEHWHEPEEFYLVLAGGGDFYSEGRPALTAGPGDVIHHVSNQKHAISMSKGPLLAAALWRGKGLLAKPDLEKTQ